MNQVREKSSDGLNREEIEWIFDRYQQLRADLFERIIADGARFLASVDKQQVRNLEQAFRKDNDKMETSLRGNTDKRLSERSAEALERLKDWLGSLTKEQRQQIVERSRSLPDLLRVRLEFQRRRQQEVVQLLRSSKNSEILSQRLHDWLVFPERSAQPDYQLAQERMKDALKEMVLAIDRIITPQQRAHALANCKT